MTEVQYLDLEDLLGLVRTLGAGPVRDVGLLDSAAGRPRASAVDREAYPTLPVEAAALLHSVAGNHALVDGNKRLARLACVVLLDIDGAEPGLNDDEAFALVMDVAGTHLDVDTVADRLRVRPAPA